MAQHDYVINNQSGASFRSDINNALSAIVSQNSGATAPSTTYAYQSWADTTAGVMKIRNAANSAWITLYQLDGEWTTIAMENGTAAAPSIYFKVSGTDTGIFSPGTNSVAISTGGTQRATVDSSGRLLVGTSTARANFNNTTGTAAFQVEGTTANTSNVAIVRNSADTGGPILTFGKTRSAAVGGTTIADSDDSLGFIGFEGSDGTEFVRGASITAEVDGTPGANDMPGRLVFSTTADGASSPTERMRITANGDCNNYTDYTNVHVARSGNAAGTTDSIYVGVRSATNTTNGTAVYRVYTNGTYATISDANQKKNIETTRDGYLEDLNRLRVVKYNWNEQTDSQPKELGLIAQEVEEVFPGLVTAISESSEESKFKGIKTSVLPYMLLKALQEATTRIETLEAEVAVLKTR